tara:strand:- start:298 stop:564 length:267 start_codon:yes stop_codon:yes gene_type:complete
VYLKKFTTEIIPNKGKKSMALIIGNLILNGDILVSSYLIFSAQTISAPITYKIKPHMKKLIKQYTIKPYTDNNKSCFNALIIKMYNVF